MIEIPDFDDRPWNAQDDYCKHNRIPLKQLMVLAAMSERLSGGSYQYNAILRTFG